MWQCVKVHCTLILLWRLRLKIYYQFNYYQYILRYVLTILYRGRSFQQFVLTYRIQQTTV